MANKEAEMFYKQAMSFLGQGEARKAIEFFDKALKFDDKYFPAWNNKGVALLELKDYRQAEECFEKVIRINPADKMALYNRGYALLMLGEYQQSVEIFDFFLANTSKKSDFFKYGLYLQAKGFYGLKEYDKARSLLKDSLKLDKKFTEAQELLNQVINDMKKE
jgi:tetratricopeptide (TPR) repeat protein